mgnify:CR=1 FL=1
MQNSFRPGRQEGMTMNQKNRSEISKDFLICVTLGAIIICAVVFLFFRGSVIAGSIKGLLGLITPFIYGFAIAYLLRPVCLFFEKWLTKLQDRFFRFKIFGRDQQRHIGGRRERALNFVHGGTAFGVNQFADTAV